MKSVLPVDPISKILLIAFIATPLALSPQFSYDPINLIKMLIISMAALIALFLAGSQKLKISQIQFRTVNYASMFFVFWSICVFVFHKNRLTQQFYGEFGRNTGLLTYVSLLTIFFFTVHKTNAISPRRILSSTIFVGTLSILYGLLQVADADPLAWISSYSPIVGFLGNPNFQSSLVAITAIAISPIVLSNESIARKLFSCLYIFIALFIIYKTNSQQGYLVFMFGFLLICYIRIRTHYKTQILHIPFLILMLASGIYVILDILNLGFGESILYKPSVSARGDFWRAGIEMIRNNPVFGVGFDAYGDNYRIVRDASAATRIEANLGSNSAHNIFLDVGSYGGFPLLFAYLFLQILTLFAIVRIIKRMNEFNFVIVGLIGAWIGYLSQSIISISQIGLAIWGWMLSGVIIGIDINQRMADNSHRIEKPQQGKTDNRVIQKAKHEADLLAYALGLMVGLILSIPPLLADANFRSAVESRKVDQIINSANRWPQNSVRYDAAFFLLKKEFPVQATEVARTATKKIPYGYPGWRNLFNSPNATSSEKQIAKNKLEELDPLTDFETQNLN